jgi:hypothetical protein
VFEPVAQQGIVGHVDAVLQLVPVIHEIPRFRRLGPSQLKGQTLNKA